MNNVDTRQVNRDSVFLLAQLRVGEEGPEHPVKIRNLSPRGAMAEGDVKVMRGAQVMVELRNIGWVEGTVAWKQDNRFGIAFTDEIESKLVRAPAGPAVDQRPALYRSSRVAPPPPAGVRKI